MLSTKKIGIIGLVNENGDKDAALGGGQLTKTRNIRTVLVHVFGSEDIITLDTYKWKKNILHLFKGVFKIAKESSILIIMPNKKGIKVILPMVSILKSVYHYNIVYPIVGGWLPNLLEKNRWLVKYFKKIDYILPETNKLAEELQEYNIDKMDVMPIFSNRKKIDVVKKYEESNNFRFCTFSRVLPEKGIDDAIEAISIAGKNNPGVHFHLDVCGPIDKRYKKHYEMLFRKNTNHVTYCGILPDDRLIEILSQYYMLLFPTFYEGEAFPATICEAYMAGLPVLASKWRFNEEVVQEGITGLLFNPHDTQELATKIEYVAINMDMVNRMKENCILKSNNYSPESATAKMITWIKAQLV